MLESSLVVAAIIPDPLQALFDLIAQGLQNLATPIQPLIDLIATTPLNLTTENPIVMQAWQTMTIVADLFLGLFLIVGAIQMMYGDNVGSLRMPVGQFVGKAILTAILIHLSAFIGQTLLTVNNLLSELVRANVQDFIQQITNGQLFNGGQTLLLSLILGVVFGISLFRVIFQAIKRVIRFILLFVLSGPAFLTSFHPATAPIFSTWARLYVATIFEQFIQFLTFGLGVQFLIATKQTGLTGFILAIAMLNMTAEVPALLTRFGAAAGGQSGGLDSLVNTAVKVGVLFA